MINGKTHYKWPFSIAMLVYQRVPQVVPCLLHKPIYEKPIFQADKTWVLTWLTKAISPPDMDWTGAAVMWWDAQVQNLMLLRLSSLGSKLVHIIEITVDNNYIYIIYIYIYYDDLRRCSMNSRSRFFLCNLPHHAISPTILNQNHPKENGLCLEIGYHGYHGSSSSPWNGNFVA